MQDNGVKRKPTSSKNPQANDILERIYAVFTNMLSTAELDMAELVNASGIDIFLADAAWAICSTHHTVLKASPGAAIFGRDILFDIPLIADWKTIGEHRQRLTDHNTDLENKGRIDYDYIGQKILVRNEGILRKAQSIWQNNPWTITTVHTNETITVQHGNKLVERLNIRRVKPFEE
jgi:hypothetical protein